MFDVSPFSARCSFFVSAGAVARPTYIRAYTVNFAAKSRSHIIPHSAFRIPHSAFRIPHSAFRIPHSPFRIPHSAFPIPHSDFTLVKFPLFWVPPHQTHCPLNSFQKQGLNLPRRAPAQSFLFLNLIFAITAAFHLYPHGR